jgi:hypothetical protein
MITPPVVLFHPCNCGFFIYVLAGWPLLPFQNGQTKSGLTLAGAKRFRREDFVTDFVRLQYRLCLPLF